MNIFNKEREELVKKQLDKYCSYLFKMPTEDIKAMLDTNQLTLVDAMMVKIKMEE
jgi:hypothetical protein